MNLHHLSVGFEQPSKFLVRRLRTQVSSEWQHAERSYPGRELRSTQTRTPSSLDEREPRLHGLRDRVGECLWPCAGIQDLPGQLSTITFFLHRLAARLVWCRNPGRSQAGA